MRQPVLNYERSSGKHPRIKCDRTVQLIIIIITIIIIIIINLRGL
jgi:hypothetical protein